MSGEQEELLAKPPPRPSVLGTVIDAQNEQIQAFDEKYIRFLQLAWESQKDMESSCLSINVNATTKQKQDETIAEGKSSAANYQVGKKDLPLNSSFSDLYDLYSTFSQGIGDGAFASLEETHMTIGTVEMEQILRDLMVLPRLVSRDDMTRVWSDMSTHKVKMKEKPMVRMNLDNFKEYFSRLALYIFCAVGMRKTIIAATGNFPTGDLMVQYLIAYMRIDDDAFMNDFITNGRAPIVDEEEKGDGDSEHLKIISNNASDQNMYKQHDDVQKKSDSRPTSREGAVDPPVMNTSNESPPPPLTKKQSFRAARSPLVKFKSNKTDLIPKEILDLLNDPSNTHIVAAEKNNTQKSDSANKIDGDKEVKKGSKRVMQPKKEYNTYLEVFNSNPGGGKDLSRALTMYCKETAVRVAINDENSSYGAFCDVGRVEPQSSCVVHLHLHNRSSKDLMLEIAANNFEDDQTKVTTSPKPLISGLTRHASVSFTSPIGRRSIVGLISLIVTGSQDNYRDVIHVPIFLCATPHLLMGSNRELRPLRVDSLESTLEKYAGKDCIPQLIKNRHESVVGYEMGMGMGMGMDESMFNSKESKIGQRQNYSPNVSFLTLGTQSQSIEHGSKSGMASSTFTANGMSSSNSAGDKLSLKDIAKGSTGLGITFAQSRDSWYGTSRVGGGGKKLENFSCERSIPGNNPHLQRRGETAGGMSLISSKSMSISAASGYRSSTGTAKNISGMGISSGGGGGRSKMNSTGKLFDDGSMAFSSLGDGDESVWE